MAVVVAGGDGTAVDSLETDLARGHQMTGGMRVGMRRFGHAGASIRTTTHFTETKDEGRINYCESYAG